MDCDKCDREAVMHAAYSGLHLCDDHFCRSVEKRLRRRIRDDDLLPASATPDDPQVWLIGLSGGKDSVVLTKILHDTFAEDPRIELVALTIHEGIEGYRDKSLDACLELTDDLDIRHEVVSYEEEFDLRMDDVVEKDPENMAACAYCGVFRRDLLSKYAEEYGADKLLTGHNLDDEAETALMNFLEGDVAQVAKHFDASLAGFDERSEQDDVRPASETPPRRSRKGGRAVRPPRRPPRTHHRVSPLQRGLPRRDSAADAVVGGKPPRNAPLHHGRVRGTRQARGGRVRRGRGQTRTQRV